MSNTEPVQEPSMEEILASIRKIISDDDSGESEQQAGGDADAAASDEAEAMADAEPAPIAETEPVEIEEPAVVEEPADIPVTEEMPAQAEEPAAMAAEEVPVMEPTPEQEPEPEPEEVVVEDDILELGEELALDVNAEATESVADMEMEQADPGTEIPAEITEIVEPNDDIEFCDPVEATAPAAEINAEAEPLPEKELLSDDHGTNIASAFGSLENLVLANEEKTLDGLVREMLKPMLKEWLDANLAPLVDRMVRDEIERVSRGRR
jgi:uncharacterized protein